MNRKHVVQHKQGAHTTKSARARRAWLLRAGVWAFILVFAFSVIGGLMIISQIGSTPTPQTAPAPANLMKQPASKPVNIPGNTYLPNAAMTSLPSHHP